MASILRYSPDLGRTVTALAADVEKVMVSLYNLQKSTNGTITPSFSHVRKGLKDQWEMLRAHLQRCHAFGVDVLMMKSASVEMVGNKEEWVEFLGEMAASANELSQTLKNRDISSSFSKENKSDGSVRGSNLPSIKGIQNPNLKAFVIAPMGSKEHQLLLEIDSALHRIKLNLDVMFQFWEQTSTGFDSLSKEFGTKGKSMTVVDVEVITPNWERYLAAIWRAILSITKTVDATLVEADGAQTRGVFMPSPFARAGGGVVKENSGRPWKWPSWVSQCWPPVCRG